MKAQLQIQSAIRVKALHCTMLGLLASLAAFPAVAASDDLASEQQAATSNRQDQPTGTNFKYLWIAGSTFHPVKTTTTYDYSGSGCVSVTGAAGIPQLAHKVVLPQGAIIRFMRLYTYDDSPTTLRAFLTTYDAQGNAGDLTNVGSETTGGYNTTLSPEFSYEIDNFNSAINVFVNLGAETTDALRFCAVRIAYDAPITDRIFADDFDFTPL